MFNIRVFLDASENESHRSLWLSGLEAVDFCRKYGLNPITSLQVKDGSTQEIPVSEGFARSFFENQTMTTGVETVYLDMLAPGELVMTGQSVTISQDLSDWRVVELYHAGAKRRLSNVIVELKEEIRQLQAPSQG